MEKPTLQDFDPNVATRRNNQGRCAICAKELKTRIACYTDGVFVSKDRALFEEGCLAIQIGPDCFKKYGVEYKGEINPEENYSAIGKTKFSLKGMVAIQFCTKSGYTDPTTYYINDVIHVRDEHGRSSALVLKEGDVIRVTQDEDSE